MIAMVTIHSVKNSFSVAPSGRRILSYHFGAICAPRALGRPLSGRGGPGVIVTFVFTVGKYNNSEEILRRLAECAAPFSE